MLEENRFILAHTSDFWATVYKKRRTTKYACNSNYDAAANINQTWYNNHYEQDCMVKQAFRNFVDYIADVSHKTSIFSFNNEQFQSVNANKQIYLNELLKLALELYIQTEKSTTQEDALVSSILLLVEKFQQYEGLTAKEAVIILMESTSMLPGVFNIQMLSWRHTLQRLVHENDENLLGQIGLQYKLSLSHDIAVGNATTRSVEVQTDLVNPNSPRILEFVKREYELKWSLP